MAWALKVRKGLWVHKEPPARRGRKVCRATPAVRKDRKGRRAHRAQPDLRAHKVTQVRREQRVLKVRRAQPDLRAHKVTQVLKVRKVRRARRARLTYKFSPRLERGRNQAA